MLRAMLTPASVAERHVGWTYANNPLVYNREVFCNYVKILPRLVFTEFKHCSFLFCLLQIVNILQGNRVQNLLEQACPDIYFLRRVRHIFYSWVLMHEI